MLNRKLPRAIAALAVAAFVAGSAGAQEQKTSKGDVARAPTIASLMSAIEGTQATVTAIKAREAIKADDIILVDASTVIGAQSDSSVKAALMTQSAHVDSLRAAIGARAEVTALLDKQSVKLTAADVIAAEVLSDDKILVYFRKPS
jgi:hypothetical protein